MTTKYLGDGVWARRTNIDSADIMLPVERQGVHSERLSMNSGVVVSPSATNDSSTWMSCEGFDKIAVTLKNSGSFNSSLEVLFSHDATNIDGAFEVLPNDSAQYRAGEAPVCAHYFKFRVRNGHTAPATITTNALLKA